MKLTMYFSVQALALTALSLDCAFAQPARHGHQYAHKRGLEDVLAKRQDWSNPAIYAGVDWSKVNYGGGSPPPASSPPPAAAANPAPAANSSPSPAPVAVREKAAVAPTSSPAPASDASTSGGSGGGQRGLAYNPSSPNLNIFDGYSKITWGYNWDSLPAGLPSQFEYVPTLFSNAQLHTGQWAQNAGNAITAGAKYFMSFNEPDQPNPQADMSVGVAVAAWKQYMEPYANQVKLGSPSVSNGVGQNQATGQPMGLDWLTPFLQQCSGCSISFVPVHWYGCNAPCDVTADITAFKTQITQAMQAAGSLPIWVTEFGTNSGDPTTFMSEVLPWLDSQDQVERYAYFMVEDGKLTSGNSLSALGQQYASS